MSVVDQITYKPGWRFAQKGTLVQVTARVPSSSDPNKHVNISHCFDHTGTDVELIWEVMKTIEFLEAHEFAEFFKLNGRRIINPHGPVLEAMTKELQHVR